MSEKNEEKRKETKICMKMNGFLISRRILINWAILRDVLLNSISIPR